MFWVWLLIALFGEMGLALFVLGALTETGLLWLASEPVDVRTVTFSLLWWAGGAVSTAALVPGLRGLRGEQQLARDAEKRQRRVPAVREQPPQERPARAA